jgi:dCMP deaminase
MPRPSADKYFMEMVDLVSKRTTCLRRSVGAVLVKDGHIISTGYNGAPRGMKHCDEVGCIRQKLNVPSGERHELCRAVHAEQNAIVQAAYHGISTKDSTMYVSLHPCVQCVKILINAGVKEVVFESDNYNDDLSKEMLKESGVVSRQFPPPPIGGWVKMSGGFSLNTSGYSGYFGRATEHFKCPKCDRYAYYCGTCCDNYYVVPLEGHEIYEKERPETAVQCPVCKLYYKDENRPYFENKCCSEKCEKEFYYKTDW